MTAPAAGGDFLLPDGSVSGDLKKSIRQRVRHLPTPHRARDMAARDAERAHRTSSSMNSEAVSDSRRRASRDEDSTAGGLSAGGFSLADSVFGDDGPPDAIKKRTGAHAPRRQKMPYSTSSLANLMLKAEYD